MPYVIPEAREELNPILFDLDAKLKSLAHKAAMKDLSRWAQAPSDADELAAAAGLFNYCITTLAVRLTGKPRYARCALIRAVMADAADEYYRRLVAPYEDEQARKNGDCYS
jgi:hypothetical protein